MQGSERYGPKPAPKTEACVWLETTMPHRSRLPLEILDYIVDFLHDERDTLKNCCLVSKSWVPRTRQHLFGDVKFHSATDLMLWKETFPDQSDSPACHTHTLFVACPEEVTAVDAERGGWIPSFSRVVELVVYSNPSRLSKPVASLTPFCVLSPVLKSLHIRYSNLSNSQIFDLIRSLPLLEDLTLYIRGIDDDVLDLDAPSRVFQPTSPAFTGTLDLTVFKKLQPTARRFLDLSGGLHFRELVLSCLYVEDIQWINTLVVKCSDALERLTLRSTPHGAIVFLPRSTHNSPSLVRQLKLDSYRPLESDKTQRCGFYICTVAHGMDRSRTANHHTKTSRLSKYMYSLASRPALHQPRGQR